MTNLKKVLLASAALTMLSGAAYADGNNKLYLKQSSSQSQATINQYGNGGEVGLKQNSGTGNSANIQQGGTGNYVGDRNDTLNQTGNNNQLVVNQDGTRNDVNKGDQTGNRNFLKINQGGSNTSGLNNKIEFTQTSDGVNNFQYQGNGERDAPAGLGSRNGTYSPFGAANYASASGNTGKWGFISQYGNNNTLTLTQNSGVGGYGNGLIADQSGTNGTIGVKQTGGNNFAYTYQGAGNKNKATIDQDNTAADGIDNYNLIDVRQGNGGQYSNNTATLTQRGTRQETYVDQLYSNDSTATVMQSGNDNFASLSQSGSFHQATLTQSGSLNDTTIRQSGMHNISDVTQSGTSGSIDITQSVQDNYALVDQSGTGNTATITQSGFQTTPGGNDGM